MILGRFAVVYYRDVKWVEFYLKITFRELVVPWNKMGINEIFVKLNIELIRNVHFLKKNFHGARLLLSKKNSPTSRTWIYEIIFSSSCWKIVSLILRKVIIHLSPTSHVIWGIIHNISGWVTQQHLILGVWTVFKSLILSISYHNGDILTKALFISLQGVNVCVWTWPCVSRWEENDCPPWSSL